MDIFDGLRVIGRWWFVTVPLALLALLLASFGTAGIDPEYAARGSVMLVSPGLPTGDDSDLTNPLLFQSGALEVAAEVAALSANTPQVAQILSDEGLSTGYEVGTQNRTPIVLIETRGPTREVATNTAVRVVDLIQQDLRLRQDAAGAPDDQRITVEIISLSAIGGADYGGRNRVRVASAVVGLGLAFLTAFVLEGASRRRHMTEGDEPDEMPHDDQHRNRQRHETRSVVSNHDADHDLDVADYADVARRSEPEPAE